MTNVLKGCRRLRHPSRGVVGPVVTTIATPPLFPLQSQVSHLYHLQSRNALFRPPPLSFNPHKTLRTRWPLGLRRSV